MTLGWSSPWGSTPWGGVSGSADVGPSVTYRLVLAERSATGLGAAIISDVLALGVPFENESACRWTRTLNAAGSIEFTLPIDACTQADFAVGERELHLYRDDGSGELLVWSGRLWAADVRVPWVRFVGFGFYEDLRHREMSDDFYMQAIEQRSIAWQMINYTQNETGGDLGITRASAAGSATTRTVLYCAEQRQNIAEAIEDLASADDGFDFEVGIDKAWRTWAPSRGEDRTSDVVLDTATSIVGMSYTIDATNVENDVAGIGKKGDCEPITYSRAVDTDSRDRFGLMQGTLERSDIKADDEMIAALAREQLSLQKEAHMQPTVRCFQGLIGVSPLTGDFDLGDVIGLVSSYGFATFTGSFRVLSYTVNVDRVGHEMIDFTLDLVGALALQQQYAQTLAVSVEMA